MRIAYLTSEYISEKVKGGLAAYLGKITEIMSDKGHDIIVIVLSDKNEKIHYKNRIDVVRVKQIFALNEKDYEVAKVNLMNSWKLHKALIKENKEKKIDIVQAANYRAVGVFRSFRIPTVVRISSDSALWRNAAEWQFDYEKAVKEKKPEDYLELLCIKWADNAFAPSRVMADVISKRAKKQLKVIETPYMPGKEQICSNVYEQKLKGKRYLLMNSTLSSLKGTHLILNITEVLMKAYPDLYLVYAGRDYGITQKNGGRQSVAQILSMQNKLYDGRVVYLGILNQNELFAVIQNACACVLPSRVDNLPNSCIEAMALRQIVIGTYGASFEQLIVNKKNGLLFRRDSEKALFHAIKYLMNMTEQEREQMREEAQKSIERLSPDVIYEKMFSLYEKTRNRSRRIL